MDTESETTQVLPNWEKVFAERVRSLRKGLGLTQDEFATQLRDVGLEFNQSKVDRVERGVGGVRLNDAAAIARFFGLPLEKMTTGDPRVQDRVVEAERQLRRAAADIATWQASNDSAHARFEEEREQVAGRAKMLQNASSAGELDHLKAEFLPQAASALEAAFTQLVVVSAELRERVDGLIADATEGGRIPTAWFKGK